MWSVRESSPDLPAFSGEHSTWQWNNSVTRARVTRYAPLPPASSGLMLRPASATRLLTLHSLPQPSALRTSNALFALRRRPPPTPYRARRSVATLVTEASGAQHSILTHAPVLKDIEDSEYDTDLLPAEEAKLEITQSAAEVCFQLSLIPDPLFAASKFTSVPLLNIHADGWATSSL